ncbi:cytochrome P450 4B1-like isoform X1 [Protopterus annectens]|uniref:cytochrome P450 4B1-like isoform X1 n=1 Tax=Protopterus annectens TaxID=7888 RepID=UPI001CF9B497|nr:cytochrome P450 4B1-like isoform X1 [Protopterus annectens]
MASSGEQVARLSWFSWDPTRLLHLTATFFLAYILLTAIRLFRRRRWTMESFTKFPGPPMHWLYGHVHEFLQDGTDLDKTMSWARQYSCSYPLWFGPFMGYLTILHPDYAKTILATTEPKDNVSYRFIIPWIGEGLLVLSGQKWFRHRRLLTPGFHYNILKPYVKLVAESTKVMLDKLERLMLQGSSVEMYQHVSLMTLDSIMKCVFSYSSNFQIDSENSYIKAVYDLTYLTNLRFRCFPYHSDLIFNLSPHGFHFRKACKLAHEHTEKVIQKRKESLKNEKELVKSQQKSYLDFLDILLCARDEDGKGLSDEDICAEVDTFMFAGHDTTASGISWIMYCMAIYPEHQTKCREEILHILNGREALEWNDLSEMTYTTMTIKECLRLYPPIPGIARKLTKPITFFDGRSLPAESLIGISIYCIHRHEDFWENPEVFDPLRFSPERSDNRHPHAFIPFAAGPRNCIGQHFAMNEMKVAIAQILARFELSPDPANPPIKIPQLVLRSKNGIHLNLKKVI